MCNHSKLGTKHAAKRLKLLVEPLGRAKKASSCWFARAKKGPELLVRPSEKRPRVAGSPERKRLRVQRVNKG